MRETGREFGRNPNLLTSPRSVDVPPPLAVARMLGLTRGRGQATAVHISYDFSLGTSNSPVFSGL
jgi:hypothetical protein